MDARGTLMNRHSWLSRTYWAHFAKPATDRELFRFLANTPIGSIVEFGVGKCQRLRRIARVVQLTDGVEKLRYVGTDEFEAAADPSDHVSLKKAHQIAGSLDFKVTLMPGDAASAAPRVAHKVGLSDVVIVNGGMNPADPLGSSLGPWLSRLTHENSRVFACEQPGETLELVNPNLLTLVERHAA
jgi:hypothetical protein